MDVLPFGSVGAGCGWKRALGFEAAAACMMLSPESGMCQAPGLSHFFAPSSGRGVGAVIGAFFFWLQNLGGHE